MREFAIRAGVIDGYRQLVGQHFRQLLNRNVVFRSELPDRVIAQNLPQLIRRDRQILTAARSGRPKYQTASNRSITRVSASPASVHSAKAGKAIIVSM